MTGAPPLSDRLLAWLKAGEALAAEVRLLEAQAAQAEALRPGHRLGANGRATATLEEACAYTGLSREVMLHLLETGFVRYRKPGREYLIPWRDLDAYLEGSDSPSSVSTGPRP